MTVSVCLIVRNEEANLSRAIQSIPSSFEIVVVDTGSSDRTVEIALQHQAKVSSYKWQDDFSAARNESISKAQGDYIIIMDADEVLAPDTEEQVRNFIRKYPKSAGTVTIHNVIGNEIHKHHMVRFFPNEPSFRFRGIVHEMLYDNDVPAEHEDTGITVRHFGYQDEFYKDGGKSERYLELYATYLRKNPNDGYMLYQLGKLHYSLKDYRSALETFEHCFRIGEEERLYYPVMLVMLGYTLKELGQSGSAEQLLLPFLDKYPVFPDLPFLLGLLAMDTGKLHNIEAFFMRAIAIGETLKYSSVEGVGTYKAAYNLGIFYEIMGDKIKASSYYRRSASWGYKPANERLSRIMN